MTSLFDVIAHEDADGHRNVRHATVAARTRVEDVYGSWVRQDPVARLAHIKDEIESITRQACEEFGVGGEEITVVAKAITASYRPAPQPKTASLEFEAGRMPRMCPFHKDVTEISLNSGDPASGFGAMAQHWGGPRHCEGDGYEGDSCKFKPQMTTQSWWDQRAEKTEQRKKERAEQAELEIQHQTEEAEAVAEFSEPLDQETEIPDNVVEVDFAQSEPVSEGGSESMGEEIPMSMAAKTAAHDEPCPQCKGTGTGQLGDQCPKCKGSGFLHGSDVAYQKRESPSQAFDIFKAKPLKNDFSHTHTADSENEIDGKGPEPKMDKSKWLPKGLSEIETDDPKGAHPTVRQDIVEVNRPTNNDIRHPGDYDQIGKQQTERIDVTKKVDNISGDHTETFSGGPTTAVSSVDVDRNPIIEMMQGNYDGFTPQATVEQAILAHKRQG